LASVAVLSASLRRRGRGGGTSRARRFVGRVIPSLEFLRGEKGVGGRARDVAQCVGVLAHERGEPVALRALHVSRRSRGWRLGEPISGERHDVLVDGGAQRVSSPRNAALMTRPASCPIRPPDPVISSGERPFNASRRASSGSRPSNRSTTSRGTSGASGRWDGRSRRLGFSDIDCMIMGPLPARPGPGYRYALTGSAAPRPGNRAEWVTPTTTHSSPDRPELGRHGSTATSGSSRSMAQATASRLGSGRFFPSSCGARSIRPETRPLASVPVADPLSASDGDQSGLGRQGRPAASQPAKSSMSRSAMYRASAVSAAAIWSRICGSVIVPSEPTASRVTGTRTQAASMMSAWT